MIHKVERFLLEWCWRDSRLRVREYFDFDQSVNEWSIYPPLRFDTGLLYNFKKLCEGTAYSTIIKRNLICKGGLAGQAVFSSGFWLGCERNNLYYPLFYITVFLLCMILFSPKLKTCCVRYLIDLQVTSVETQVLVGCYACLIRFAFVHQDVCFCSPLNSPSQ